MKFDIILSGGTVYDGTGTAPTITDIAISDGVISFIGDASQMQAVQTIDCSGLAVSPGFIDIHAHSDATLLYNPRGESKIRQGVTTECTSQCGLGIFPVSEANKPDLAAACSFVMAAPVELSWQSTAEYLQKMREAGPCVNVAPMVAHGPIRAEVLGFEAKPASPDEIAQMCDVLQICFDEGAIGLSFGLAYSPGANAETAEVESLCAVAARNSKHVSVHIRNEGPDLMEALDEVIGIARRLAERNLDLRLQIDHMKCAGPRNWHFADHALEFVQNAHDEGLNVAFDVYPYNVASRHLAGSFPPSMHSGGNVKLLERLADPQIRAKLREQQHAYNAGQSNHHPFEFEYDRIRIVDLRTEANRHVIGKFLSEIIDEDGGDPIDVVCDLLIEEEADVNVALYSMDETNVAKTLAHPLSIIGSDGFALAPYGALASGKPHPRSYGTFPRFLGYWVRDKGILSLPEAIAKCTSRPAARLNLTDRGTIASGKRADITVFDPATIIDKATFEDPHRYPEGVLHVIVNGLLTINNAEHTGASGGMVLSN